MTVRLDDVRFAVGLQRDRAVAIAEACHAAGQFHRCERFIADGTSVQAVRAALAQPPDNRRAPNPQGDNTGAFAASWLGERRAGFDPEAIRRELAAKRAAQ